MACEICGRGACTRSFHSLREQEDFDNPQQIEEIAALESRVRELEGENALMREAIEKAIEHLDPASVECYRAHEFFSDELRAALKGEG